MKIATLSTAASWTLQACGDACISISFLLFFWNGISIEELDGSNIQSDLLWALKSTWRPAPQAPRSRSAQTTRYTTSLGSLAARYIPHLPKQLSVELHSIR
jgi:hypothetical protein